MPDQDASNIPRDQLAPEMLLYGFMRAVGRFTRSGLSGENLTEPDQDDDLDRQVLAVEWSNAVFEALMVGDPGRANPPRLQKAGLDGRHRGRKRDPSAPSRPELMHHDWSAALDIGLAPDEFLAPHATVFGITWVDELAVGRPDQRGAAAYADTLAGRNVGETLLAAGKVYEENIKACRPRTPHLGK